MNDTMTVQMDGPTQRFYQGAAAANRVIDEHAAVEFPDHEARVAMFWFYVGALAAGEYECTTSEDFGSFVRGANTRAPQADTPQADEEHEEPVEPTEFDPNYPGMVDAYGHADGSITYIVVDEDGADGNNPRTFDGNVATLIQTNSRCIDIDSDDAGLGEMRQRLDDSMVADPNPLILRYLSIYRPDILYYSAHWSAGDSYGWGYVTAEAWKKTMVPDEEDFLPDVARALAPEVFDQEVKVYGQWANGEIYRSIHIEPDGTEDSCGGHLGYDDHKDIATQYTDSPITETLH